MNDRVWERRLYNVFPMFPRLQSVRDSHHLHPVAVWFILLLLFPKTLWVFFFPLASNLNLSVFLLTLFFILPPWNQITLPASPVTAQLIGRTQASNSTAAATTISQQAMLLGNRPANCNQAQMYLRTQMVHTFILTITYFLLHVCLFSDDM